MNRWFVEKVAGSGRGAAQDGRSTRQLGAAGATARRRDPPLRSACGSGRGNGRVRRRAGCAGRGRSGGQTGRGPADRRDRQGRATFVAIYAKEGQGGGSGVVISPDGYALTNFHVTHEAGIGMKCGMSDGRLYDAVVVGVDPTGDLSLIKLLGRDRLSRRRTR